MENDLKAFESKLTEVKTSIEGHIEKLAKDTSDQAKAEIASLRTELDATKKSLNSLEEQMKQAKAMAIPGLKEELKKNPFSWTSFVGGMYKMARAAHSGVSISLERAFEEAGHELEIVNGYMKKRNAEPVNKSNYASDGTAGGYLIPEEVSNEVIDMTIANMPIMTMGVTRISGLVGDLPIPKKTGRSTGYMVGENEAPTSSKVTYGEATLRPHKAGAFTKQSNRLVHQSRGVSDRIIMQDISEALALLFETQLINGTGTNKDVLGLLNQTNINTFTNSGVDRTNSTSKRFTIDDAAQMLMKLDVADEYKPGGSYGFLMRPEVLWGMKRERIKQYSGQPAGDGLPVMAMNLLMNNAVLENQLGVKLATSTLVTKYTGTLSKVIGGNWKQFYVAMWRDFVVKVSDVAGDGSTGSAFTQDQMYIVAFQEFDCNVMRGAAFTTATGCDTDSANW